jgi:hypothetical protein
MYEAGAALHSSLAHSKRRSPHQKAFEEDVDAADAGLRCRRSEFQQFNAELAMAALCRRAAFTIALSRYPRERAMWYVAETRFPH